MIHTTAEKLAALLANAAIKDALKHSAYTHLAHRRALDLALHMHEHGIDPAIVSELSYKGAGK